MLWPVLSRKARLELRRAHRLRSSPQLHRPIRLPALQRTILVQVQQRMHRPCMPIPRERIRLRQFNCLSVAIEVGVRGRQRERLVAQRSREPHLRQQPHDTLPGVELRPPRRTGQSAVAKLRRLLCGRDATILRINQPAGPHMNHAGIERRLVSRGKAEIRRSSTRSSTARPGRPCLRSLQIHMHLTYSARDPLPLVILELASIDAVLRPMRPIQHQHGIVELPPALALRDRLRRMQGEDGPPPARLRVGKPVRLLHQVHAIARQDALPHLAGPILRQPKQRRQHRGQKQHASEQSPPELLCRPPHERSPIFSPPGSITTLPAAGASLQ